MVLFIEGLQDIAVFSAGRSLVSQLTRWSERHHGFALRLISRSSENAGADLGGAVFCVIDATADARSVVPVLEDCIDRIGADHVAVYSEVSDGSLERIVRSYGVLYWLGPLGQPEWEWAFRSLEPARASSAPTEEPYPWHTQWEV